MVASSRGVRSILLLLLTLLVAATCVRLGFWQLDRLSQRRAFNEQVQLGMDAPPAPVAPLVDGADHPDELAFRQVDAVGTYDADHEVILYGRPLDGRPGNHVLTPLVLEDGRAIVVDRGWVPSEVDAVPLAGDAEAPSQVVTVRGVLLRSDGDAAAGPDEGPVTTVREVDVALLDRQIPADLLPGVYLLLREQDPTAPLPVPAALPELSEGPHLGYALQWFGFALIALIGYGLLARRERHRAAESTSAASHEEEG